MWMTLTFRMGQRKVLDMSMERPSATFYLLAISMFALSVTVCEIFSDKMCMTLTLTLTVRMCYGQTYTCQSNGNSNVCPICHCLRDNQVWTPKCSRVEFWPWKWRSRPMTMRMKLARRIYFVDIHICKEMARLGPALCFRWHFVRTYINRQCLVTQHVNIHTQTMPRYTMCGHTYTDNASLHNMWTYIHRLCLVAQRVDIHTQTMPRYTTPTNSLWSVYKICGLYA